MPTEGNRTIKTFYSNCYVWAIKQRIQHGGKINIRRTITWIGPHTTWTSNKGIEYEFTYVFPRKAIIRNVIWYKGCIKRIEPNGKRTIVRDSILEL
jgi:hypothetical protein